MHKPLIGPTRAIRAILLSAAAFALLACAEGAREADSASAIVGATAFAVRDTSASTCYRTPTSILLGPDTTGSQRGVAPGWIRFDGSDLADSGSVHLVDSNGSGLNGLWRRLPGDSAVVFAFDDFLQVGLRVHRSMGRAAGTAKASSDAVLIRDSTGGLVEMQRSWQFVGTAAPCDSMPMRR
jgi:hypothetical protein